MVIVRYFCIFFLAFFSVIDSHSTEFHIDIGAVQSEAEFLTGIEGADRSTESSSGYYFGVGAKRKYGVSKNHFFGVGVDVFDFSGQRFTGFRALDYQYGWGEYLRLGGFFGAASLESGRPQNGFYLGVNVALVDLYKHTGIRLEFKRADGLARDRFGSEQGSRPDVFADINSFSLSVLFTF